MIRITIRVFVYALVLAVTVLLSPGIRILPLIPGVIEISATYIIFGVLFGLFNAFIKPIVLLFTARSVLSTMGLFAFIINTFLFWLMSLVFPEAFVISDPWLLWLLLGGVILSIVLLLMEAFFGLEMPALRSQIETQYYWRWLGMLSTGRRNRIAENLRASQITDIIMRYTEDIAVEMTPLAELRNYVQAILFHDVDVMRSLTLPEKVRYMLQELGPTFVKFGQIVSSRTADLPPEWQEQLNKLQSNVPPFSYEKAREIVSRELKGDPDTLFATFEAEPFAAASTAQVHRATLHDGSHVVVKIQRPNIDVAVQADLNIINDLTAKIQRKQEWAQTLDLHGLFEEFGDSILHELDYRNEASNVGLLAQHGAVRYRARTERESGPDNRQGPDHGIHARRADQRRGKHRRRRTGPQRACTRIRACHDQTDALRRILPRRPASWQRVDRLGHWTNLFLGHGAHGRAESNAAPSPCRHSGFHGAGGRLQFGQSRAAPEQSAAWRDG